VPVPDARFELGELPGASVVGLAESALGRISDLESVAAEGKSDQDSLDHRIDSLETAERLRD
jgi:hypothetical protein